MATDNLTPKERAVKNYMGGMSPSGKKSLMKDVGRRIKRQAANQTVREIDLKKKVKPETKKQKKARRRILREMEARRNPEQALENEKARKKAAKIREQADNIGKNRRPPARMKAKPAKPAKTPPAKMQAKSAPEPAAKTQTKTAKPEPKIEKLKPEKPKVKIEKDIDLGPDKTKSQKARKILGKGVKQVAQKVAAPLAAVDAVQLALSEDARREAKDDFDAMGDDTAALRAAKSFFNPIDTIYAAGAALRDAGANVSEPDFDQIELDTKVRGVERQRELEKRYAAMSPEEQAAYDENRNAVKEEQRARQVKRIMENRASAQRRIENKNATLPLPDDGSEYFFRDREGRDGYFTPEGYLEETEYIAASQKAAADKAAAEKAAAEKAAADKVAAEEAAIAKAAADKAAAAAAADAEAAARIERNPFHEAEQAIKARQAEQARQSEQAEQAARQAEYAEFRDSSAEDYIKKLEQEAAFRRAILNKPLP